MVTTAKLAHAKAPKWLYIFGESHHSESHP